MIIGAPIIYIVTIGMALLGYALRVVHELWIGACAIAIVLIPLELLWRIIG